MDNASSALVFPVILCVYSSTEVASHDVVSCCCYTCSLSPNLIIELLSPVLTTSMTSDQVVLFTCLVQRYCPGSRQRVAVAACVAPALFWCLVSLHFPMIPITHTLFSWIVLSLVYYGTSIIITNGHLHRSLRRLCRCVRAVPWVRYNPRPPRNGEWGHVHVCVDLPP